MLGFRGCGGGVACTWGCTPVVVYFVVLHLLFVLVVICTGLETGGENRVGKPVLLLWST